MTLEVHSVVLLILDIWRNIVLLQRKVSYRNLNDKSWQNVLTASLFIWTIVAIFFFITLVMAWNTICVIEFVRFTGKLPSITFGSGCKNKTPNVFYHVVDHRANLLQTFIQGVRVPFFDLWEIIPQKRCTFDPMLVKSKCVWEAYIYF